MLPILQLGGEGVKNFRKVFAGGGRVGVRNFNFVRGSDIVGGVILFGGRVT